MNTNVISESFSSMVSTKARKQLWTHFMIGLAMLCIIMARGLSIVPVELTKQTNNDSKKENSTTNKCNKISGGVINYE